MPRTTNLSLPVIMSSVLLAVFAFGAGVVAALVWLALAGFWLTRARPIRQRRALWFLVAPAAALATVALAGPAGEHARRCRTGRHPARPEPPYFDNHRIRSGLGRHALDRDRRVKHDPHAAHRRERRGHGHST